MLTGRRVVLGVSGGVAAYKAAYLARRLTERGAEVRVVTTASARAFVGDQTFAAITGHRVVDRLFGVEGSVSPHTELGRWADVVVIAPATAATIARLAHGLSEDALTATVLASRAPLVVAPAMHTEMWEHPATRRNVRRLEEDGVRVVAPGEGPLAGGDVGVGRMAEPEEIVEVICEVLGEGPLQGVSVLVTAGGTREPIDPVRFLGNRSSGKMGHAIAEEALRRGARVVLVTAADLASSPGIERIQVETAAEMEQAVASVQPDVAILAAAVADFRPKAPAADKISRTSGPPSIELEATPDILAGVVGRTPRPLVVGFAAETGSLDRAVRKAQEKGVDLLVANDVTEPGAGFAVDTNRVTIIWPDGRSETWPLMPKSAVAARLLDLVEGLLGARTETVSSPSDDPAHPGDGR